MNPLPQLLGHIPLVRRPFFQRDQARAEVARLVARLAAAECATVRPNLRTNARSLTTHECKSLSEFMRFQAADREVTQYIAPLEERLLPRGETRFTLPGYCAVCASYTDFLVDYTYAPPPVNGVQLPNWRERLECGLCGLNNRMRAVLHFMQADLNVERQAHIYITEQITPLFRAFQIPYENVTGSEYLRDGTLPGQRNEQGVRHEDVTALTFPASSFDTICSFEVLEHVPSYQDALAEFFRCLKPGGNLVLTVPFSPDSATTLTRAAPAADGNGIVHFEPPEYHGDPLDNGGTLCFYHFGWDLLDRMRQIGFSDPKLSFYWSLEAGYLGGRQFLISASRP